MEAAITNTLDPVKAEILQRRDAWRARNVGESFPTKLIERCDDSGGVLVSAHGGPRVCRNCQGIHYIRSSGH